MWAFETVQVLHYSNIASATNALTTHSYKTYNKLQRKPIIKTVVQIQKSPALFEIKRLASYGVQDF